MKFMVGNLLDDDIISVADCIAITTNGVVKANGLAVMGAGVAKAAALKWPTLPYSLGKLLQSNGNHVQVINHFLRGPKEAPLHVVAFPTKYNWKNPSDLILIESSAYQLKGLADDCDWKRVYLSPPGCGHGGLAWAQVEPVLAPYLDDRFTIVSFKKL